MRPLPCVPSQTVGDILPGRLVRSTVLSHRLATHPVPLSCGAQFLSALVLRRYSGF
jgi:hypothetical protein